MTTFGDMYDYPRYYDLAYNTTTEAEGAFYFHIFNRKLQAFSSLLDLGCGSGRVTAELARTGISCTGVDEHPAMLAYFNERAARESLDMKGIFGDIVERKLDTTFDAAVCAGDTIRYILDPGDLKTHLVNVAAALRPGGVYAIDTCLVGPPDKYTGDAGRWTVVEGSVTIKGTFFTYTVDRSAKTERILHGLLVNDGPDEYILTEDADLHAFNFDDYRAIIEDAGVFHIESCFGEDYDPENIITPDDKTEDIVILLRKKCAGR